MKNLLLLVAFLLIGHSLLSQSWNIVDENQMFRNEIKVIDANEYVLASIDDSEIKKILWSAPAESGNNFRSRHILKVMLADGTIDAFNIVEYKMMEAPLAKKFPDFKTYRGISNSNPHRGIRLDYTSFGFRAVVTDPEGNHYIDHFTQNDKELRIIYQKPDLNPTESWECGVNSIKEVDLSAPRLAGDCELRTYRLACAATGEYTAFHGGTVAQGQASIVTAINRVNEIYEQDFTARFILVGNNDQLVYTNAGTDPYNNNNGGQMLGQNQSNIDAVIGNANYDVGHVFSTGGGGIAGLGVLCVTGNKARGVTGLPNPTGDPFWIDYVAHEIGHQFGCNHTFNNSCGGNRNNLTAVEPGSGSTIMAYAGICNPNVQNQSDAYFHGISIQEASSVILGASCQNTIPFNNSAPVLTDLQNYTVPASSFLVLEASATDLDNDPLTYCWEQFDNQTGFTMPPSATSTGGPLFRSLDPSSNSARYLPSIDNIINGTSDTWEVLPSVSRTMNWRVTVRDHALEPGCTDEQDMIITVDGNSGPFVLNSFNNPSIVTEGEIVTLNWDVAGTNLSPVNTANVDILLSYDGGLTYPTTILNNTPNDGLEDVTIPVGTTTQGRIMVRGSGNIFFDINDANIEIQSGSPTYTLSLDPSTGEACPGESENFTLNSSSINGFSDPINLSVTGLPPGATSSITPNPLNPGSSSMIELDNFGLNTGNFAVSVTGIANGISREVVFDLNLLNEPTVPALSTPSDMQSNVSSQPTLGWDPADFAASYEYQLSLSPNGANIVESGMTADVNVSISTNLSANTMYYWRVRSINACGISNWSNERTFTTAAETCVIYESTDVPKNITAFGTPTVFSEVNVLESGILTDVNVLDVDITHTWTGDLRLALLPPDNQDAFYFIREECDSEDNINISFDDEATTTYPCPMIGGGTHIPEFPLANFDGSSIQGVWELAVQDVVFFDGGSLNGWKLELCYAPDCDLNVTSTNATGIGSLLDAISCAQPGQTITLSNSLANMTIDLGNLNLDIDKNLTITANPNDNIKVSYSGNDRALILNANVNLMLTGFELESTSGSSETIINNGDLTLNNMTIRNTNGNEQVVNSIGSDLNIQGNCNLEE